MANSFFNASGAPVTGSAGSSAVIRGEFTSIATGFDKLPALTANTAIVVNSAGTALTNTTGTFALAGNFSTTGAFNTVIAQGASITLTLPGASGTVATLAGTEELDGKTLDSSVGKGTWTASGTWTLPAITLGGAITYGGVTLSNAVTGTGSMVLSASPTISGTLTASALVATTINALTITSSTGTLTIAALKTITISNTLTFTGTDGSSIAFGAGGTVSYTSSSVASITGTANEITASAATGAVTLSLPSALTFTGKTITGGSYVTPALGVATATSLAIGGATIGSNALAVTGAAAISGTIASTVAGNGSAAAVYVNSATPNIGWNNSGGGVNGKRWRMGATSTTFTGSTLDDADGSGSNWLSVTRSGTAITAVTLSGSDILFTTTTTTITGALVTANQTITSASANALAVGLNGSTNPALQIDASTASSATGLKIKSAAAAGGLALSVITSGTDENLTIDAAGSGTITFGGVSTGAFTFTRASTFSAAITYGGVALSNAVTGTGAMVLASSPALTTPNIGAAAATSIAFAGGTALANYVVGTWTPADGSGAALSLTTAVGKYTRVGNMMFCQFQISYPVTVDGTAAKISGLPVNVVNSPAGQQGFISYSTDTTALRVVPLANTATFSFYTAAGVAITNAALSTDEIQGTCCYPVT